HAQLLVARSGGPGGPGGAGVADARGQRLFRSAGDGAAALRATLRPGRDRSRPVGHCAGGYALVGELTGRSVQQLQPVRARLTRPIPWSHAPSRTRARATGDQGLDLGAARALPAVLLGRGRTDAERDPDGDSHAGAGLAGGAAAPQSGRTPGAACVVAPLLLVQNPGSTASVISSSRQVTHR